MAVPYVFEYDGVKVEYMRPTTGSRMEAGRIIQKLLGAYGHVAGNPASNRAYDNFYQYANAMARSNCEAAWWCHSDMTEEQIKAAYELFNEEDDTLYGHFLIAGQATDAQKKMTTKTPQI